MFIMTKIQPNYHQGIEYILLAQLPPEQAGRLDAWLPDDSKFTLLLEDAEVRDCVGYREYERWFDNITFEASFQYYYF